jgi:hypothetical protein
MLLSVSWAKPGNQPRGHVAGDRFGELDLDEM